MDGTRSRWLAQVELLRALRRDFPDPLIELAQIARTLPADRPLDPPLDAQIDVWAKNRRLPELREVAEFYVSYWADTPAAADKLFLVMPPLTLPVVHLGPRPDTVINGGSSPMIWEPFKELNPYNPLHPVLAHPNEEELADFLARARAHYKARKKTTTPVPRPRVLTQYATWYVHRVVAQRKFVDIAKDRKLFGRKTGEIDTIKRGIREFRKRLRGK